jgi:hypothetical protein
MNNKQKRYGLKEEGIIIFFMLEWPILLDISLIVIDFLFSSLYFL